MRHSERGRLSPKQTACRRATQAQTKVSTMSLVFMLLLACLVSQCWAAPQKRNWTPQAILYLKGSQGHRSVLTRPTREEGETLNLVTLNQSVDRLGSSLASSILLKLLQRAVEEGEGNADNYPDYRDLNFNYL